MEQKFEITDSISYTTWQFTVEDQDGSIYTVRIEESLGEDVYEVMDEEGNIMDEDDVLYDELITMCEESIG